MATQVPPKRGQAFNFDVNLTSQADTDVFQTTVTLAAGDIQISKDGGQYANLATFPPSERDLAGGADSGTLRVQLTAAEMTADTICVRFHDQAGDEWQDLLVTIHTVTTNQIDDLATPGDEMDLVDAPNSTGIDALFDAVVEGGYTVRELLRVMAAALAGESSGGGSTTITFIGVDGATDRIIATVDANGNRSSVVLDVT